METNGIIINPQSGDAGVHNIDFSVAAVNESIDKEIVFDAVCGNKVAPVRIIHEGMREPFAVTEGDFILSDGGTFNVLKAEFAQDSLPAGYTKLDYLSGNGSRYIATDFCPSYATKIVADVSDVTSAGNMIYGARDTANGSAPSQFTMYRRSAGTLRAGYFGTYQDGTVSDTTTRTTITQNRNVTTAYGFTLTNTAVTSGRTTYPLWIFACNNVGSPFYPATMKLYSMQIYDNDVLVHDFQPCTNESGADGLWCKVQMKFYGFTE